MNLTVALAVTWVVCGLQFVNLDEAVQAARGDERLEGRISQFVAREAARAVQEEAGGDELEPLLRIAREGGALEPALRALLRRYAERLELPALEVLLAQPDEPLRAAAGAEFGWLERYTARLSELPRPPSYDQFVLFARVAPSQRVASLLRRLSEEEQYERFDLLLRSAGETSEPAALLDVLAPLDVSDAISERALRVGMVRVVRRSPSSLPHVLERLEQASFRARARWLASLGGAPEDGREQAVARLTQEIVEGRGEARAAAVTAYVDLDQAPSREVFSAAVSAARGVGEAAAQVLRALPELLYQYRRTLRGDLDAVRRANREARAVVSAGLNGGSPSVLAAALAAANSMNYLEPVRPMLPDLVQSTDVEVRRAAFEVIPQALEPSPEVVDLLLAAMKDPDTGEDAWQGLQRLTKVSLPFGRPDLWAQWRAAAKFGGDEASEE